MEVFAILWTGRASARVVSVGLAGRVPLTGELLDGTGVIVEFVVVHLGAVAIGGSAFQGETLFLEPFEASEVLELVGFASSVFKVVQVGGVIEGGLVQKAVGVWIAGGAQEEGVIVLEVVVVDLLQVEHFFLLTIEFLLLGEVRSEFVLEVELFFLV